MNLPTENQYYQENVYFLLDGINQSSGGTFMATLVEQKPYFFNSLASHPKNGVALIFDLEGFSQFFNQPDAPGFVPGFLNHVYDAMRIIINGGTAYWMDAPKDQYEALFPPTHEKFLGDGSLYVWSLQDYKNTQEFLVTICNRLWNLKDNFSIVLDHASDDSPIPKVPKKIRFGLTRGTIFQLTVSGRAENEYLGVCINLASRLQKYCPELGFIASARIGLSKTVLAKHGYKKVTATQLKNFQDEQVIVDIDEFSKLPSQVKERLFTEN